MPEQPQADAAIKAQHRAEKIKLLCLDIDGVLTDGTLYYSADGEQLKTFNTLDGHGIKMLQKTGVTIAIISGRSSEALKRRASDLGIAHLHLGSEDKLSALQALCTKLDLVPEEVAHVGDDLPDLPLMRAVGLGVAVPNAYPVVIQQADWVTVASGGRGAVRELCDFIMSAQGTLENALQEY